MQVLMLVSISRSDGFSVRAGQIIDAEEKVALEWCANGWAEPLANATPIRAGVKLPAKRANEVTNGNR